MASYFWTLSLTEYIDFVAAFAILFWVSNYFSQKHGYWRYIYQIEKTIPAKQPPPPWNLRRVFFHPLTMTWHHFGQLRTLGWSRWHCIYYNLC